MRTIRWAVALLITLCVAGHVWAAPAGTEPAVRSVATLRTSDPQLRHALEEGLARSSTMRDMETRLEGCSVIVYLTRTTLPSGLAGRTRIMGSGGGWRYVSIEVDRHLGALDLLAVVGHELRHAVEIAQASDVVDAESMAALYRRIGEPTSTQTQTQTRMRAFETREALEAGRRVQAEIMGWTTGAL